MGLHARLHDLCCLFLPRRLDIVRGICHRNGILKPGRAIQEPMEWGCMPASLCCQRRSMLWHSYPRYWTVSDTSRSAGRACLEGYGGRTWISSGKASGCWNGHEREPPHRVEQLGGMVRSNGTLLDAGHGL